MAIEIYDENKIRDLPEGQRFSTCEHIIKNDSDESKRWDAVWLIGEKAKEHVHIIRLDWCRLECYFTD
ncbi:MAG: hypothetical protein ACW9XA_04975 [Candidatus Nitrosopumilus sp. bin_6a]